MRRGKSDDIEDTRKDAKYIAAVTIGTRDVPASQNECVKLKRWVTTRSALVGTNDFFLSNLYFTLLFGGVPVV